jgi:hypothetical protein
MLQEIKGDPDVILWNGFVEDWNDIGEVREDFLTRTSVAQYLKQAELSMCKDKNDWSYKLTDEEREALTKESKQHPWVYDMYPDETDSKKRIIILLCKLRGLSVTDRSGTMRY